MLRYLARYVFHLAITNSRIVGLNARAVSFRYSITNPALAHLNP